MAEQRNSDSGAHELKMPRTKTGRRAPKYPWSTAEVTLPLSWEEKVRDRFIITILNERYAPTVQRIGAITLYPTSRAQGRRAPQEIKEQS